MSTMRVLTMPPPNFKAINEAFNVRGKPVIFAYGNTIYNPRRIQIGPWLVAHERVHMERQAAIAGGPEAWWREYIADPVFRLEEELPAHRAEFQFLRAGMAVDRRDAETAIPAALHFIAERLASPLYGSLIGIDEAKRLIGHAEEGAPGL